MAETPTPDISEKQPDGESKRGVKIEFFQPYGSADNVELMAKVGTPPMAPPKSPEGRVKRLAPYGSLDKAVVSTKVSPPVPAPKAPEPSVEHLAPYGSFEFTNLTAKIGPIKSLVHDRDDIAAYSPPEGETLVVREQGGASNGLRVVRLKAGNC
jgi:hypothetical protein